MVIFALFHKLFDMYWTETFFIMLFYDNRIDKTRLANVVKIIVFKYLNKRSHKFCNCVRADVIIMTSDALNFITLYIVDSLFLKLQFNIDLRIAMLAVLSYIIQHKFNLNKYYHRRNIIRLGPRCRTRYKSIPLSTFNHLFVNSKFDFTSFFLV